MQFTLGGFVASSGVVLWSFTAPLGALLFSGRRAAARWFWAFVVVMTLSAALDPVLASKTAEIPSWIRVSFFALNVLGVTGTGYLLLHYFVRERDVAADLVAAERERSERLLLNILPQPIAERLKSGESLIADGSPEVGVLFADIAGFTPLSATMEPEELVQLLNRVFTAFDALAAEYGLEKIKTIGDAYMIASGLLDGGTDHPRRLVEAALCMQREARTLGGIDLRVGIDIGPVVAGVIGAGNSVTTCGATRSTPPAGWSPTGSPAPSTSPIGLGPGCPSGSNSRTAVSSTSKAKGRCERTSCSNPPSRAPRGGPPTEGCQI